MGTLLAAMKERHQMAIHSSYKDEIHLKTVEACKSIGKRIREERKNKGMTQEKLAELAGISEKYLSAIENGNQANISIGYLVAVGVVLDLELSDWL